MTYRCPCCGTSVDAVPPAIVVEALPLSTRQRTIVETLVKTFARFVPSERLIMAVYGDRADGGPLSAASCVAVAIFGANKKLAKVRLRIESRQGSGYRLFSLDDTATLRERARAVVERELGADAARRVFMR